ncbi:MAG: antiterminator LoaP [Lachnospiraceae bacterium]|nr:antiterminator LoaP [Lachnospiraceae bacterium]
MTRERMPEEEQARAGVQARREAPAEDQALAEADWYVIQVYTGKERELIDRCQVLMRGDLDEDVFSPMREMEYKKPEGWYTKRVPMFPGYLFFTTRDVGDLYYRLKTIPAMTKLMRSDDGFYKLWGDDLMLFKHFDREDRTFPISLGFKEGDKIVITEGPLTDYPGKIVKIDRHKRIAVVEFHLFGREQQIKFGLDVMNEKPEHWDKYLTDKKEVFLRPMR